MQSAALNCLARSSHASHRDAATIIFYDLDILDHGNATTLCQLALDRDSLAAVLGELVVDWLMFANHEICFSLADDTDWPTTLDALRAAGLAMLFADCVRIDVAHHIHHFAGYFF